MRGRTVFLTDLQEASAEIPVWDVKHIPDERKGSGPRWEERAPNARNCRSTPRPSVGNYEDACQDRAERPRRLCRGRHTRQLRALCRCSTLIYASSRGKSRRCETFSRNCLVWLIICDFGRPHRTEMIGVQGRPIYEHCRASTSEDGHGRC